MESTEVVKVVPEALNDEQVLSYTQRHRRLVVDELSKKATRVPGDPKELSLMLAALDGMDRQALSNKRLLVEAQANNNTAGMSGLVAQLLRAAQTGITGTPSPQTMREAPVLGPEVPDPTLVDGELSQTPLQITFDAFQSQFKETPQTET